jgi:hypothetical protein
MVHERRHKCRHIANPLRSRSSKGNQPKSKAPWCNRLHGWRANTGTKVGTSRASQEAGAAQSLVTRNRMSPLTGEVSDYCTQWVGVSDYTVGNGTIMLLENPEKCRRRCDGCSTIRIKRRSDEKFARDDKSLAPLEGVFPLTPYTSGCRRGFTSHASFTSGRRGFHRTRP